MKRSIVVAALLLTGMILPGQNRLPFKTGKKFSYSANERLNTILAEERQKGRKLIIDLFSSSCIVCFRMMPKMQEIQNNYSQFLRVILVGKQDPDIAKIYERYRKRLSLSFEAIYDSILFRHYELPAFPHYIWLTETGIVHALTGTDGLTSENIERFISGLPFHKEAPVEKKKFDHNRLLFVNGNGGPDTSFLYRSLLSLWDKTQPYSCPPRLEYSKQGTFFQALGVSMLDLYRFAYFGWTNWTFRDSVYGKFYPVPIFIGHDSVFKNMLRYNYSFNIASPDSLCLSLQTAMRNDLATCFSYEAMITNRKMPCWKLISLPGTSEHIRSKYLQKKYSTSYSHVDFQHVPVSTVIDLLYMSRTDEYPLLDNTGIDFPVDLSFDAILYDRESVLEALRKIGLDLVLSEQPMQVLILKR